MTRLRAVSEKIRDIVLRASSNESAVLATAFEIRLFMQEFDYQISRGDEPLSDWLETEEK